jgi:Holliday junction DNA helicase RuvA
MIGKLKGTVIHIEATQIILDVNGVGYIIACPQSTIANLEYGEYADFYTEMHIKDETVILYGFDTIEQKQWFKLLTLVQGVGGKVALAILGLLPPAKLSLAISAADSNAFRQIPGIGPKLATRVVNELKDKVSSLMVANANLSSVKKGKSNAVVVDKNEAILADVVSALANLGFSRSDAMSAASQAILQTDEADFDALLKKSLSKLAG